MPPRTTTCRRLRDVGTLVFLLLAIVIAGMASCVREAGAAEVRPWTTLGGSTISLSTTQHSWQGDSVVTSAGVVWSIWEENSDIRAKSWNGTTWTDRGTVRGAGQPAGMGIDVALVNDQPWVIYAQNNGSGVYQAKIKRWTGAAWAAVGTTFNNYGVNAESLRIVARNTTSVYIGFTEFGFTTVKQVTDAGVVTDLVGASSQDPFEECGSNTIHRLDLAVVAGQLWAAVGSDACGSPSSGQRVQAWRWTAGTTWVKQGPRIDPTGFDANSQDVRITSNGTAAGTYVVWRDWVGPDATEDYAVEVRQWNTGTSTWTDLNINTATTTNDPVHLAVAPNGELWVTATDDTVSPHLFAFRWNGIAWRRYWSDTIDQYYNFSQEAEITFDSSSRPILTGRESVATYNQMFVRRFDTSNAMPGDIANVEVEPLTTTQVRLTWTIPASSNIAAVGIYRSTSAASRGTLVQTVTAPTATWTNTGLTNNTTYYYTLVSQNAAGEERGNSFETPRAIHPAGTGATPVTDGTATVWLGYGSTRSLAYDPASDLFTTNGALTTTSNRAAGVWAPEISRAVLLGGTRAGAISSAITTFDPATGIESAVVANVPAARGYPTAARSERTGLIYLFGGENASETIAYTDIYEYDPVGNAVRDTGIDLPVAASRQNALYWPEDGCFYVLGGRPTDAQPGGVNQNVRLDSVVRFCPATGTQAASVATVGTIATGVAEFGAYATDNEFVLIGGDNGTTSITQISTWSPRTGESRVAPFTLRAARVGRSPDRHVGNEDRGFFAGVYPTSDPLGRRMIQINSSPMVSVKPTTNAPATPSISAPGSGVVVGPNPTFTSSAFSDADGSSSHRASQWQVSTGGTCASIVADSRATSVQRTSFRLTGESLVQGTHSVRVRYADEGLRWSAWSTCVSFSVDATAPSAPTPTSPSSAAYVSTTPSLTATYLDTGGAVSGTVDFQLCSDASCTAVVQTGTHAGVAPAAPGSWSPAALTSGTIYYWRVRGTDVLGNVGPWSATTSLTALTVTVASTTHGVATPAPAGRQDLTIDITGTNFLVGATVAISGTGISIDSTTRVNATTMRVVVDIVSSAPLGARNVTVTNPTTPAPGGTNGVGTGVLVIGAPTITVGVTARSHDNSTDSSPTPTLSFGAVAPGSTTEIGTGSGGPSSAAVDLGISSDIDYRVDGNFSAFSGPAALTLGNLDVREHDGPGSWFDAATGVATLVPARAPEAPATSNFRYDLRLAIPGAQQAGAYSTTWTLVVVPVI